MKYSRYALLTMLWNVAIYAPIGQWCSSGFFWKFIAVDALIAMYLIARGVNGGPSAE